LSLFEEIINKGDQNLKLLTIPPYKGFNYTPEEGRFIEKAILENMRRKGQLEGVQVDLDNGYDVGHRQDNRDEEFLAEITLGMIKRVREYCETGIYDGIICLGSMGMGFMAAREISKIPVTTAVHAGFYVASILGERMTLIEATDPQALIARHWAQVYGLNNKLASVRYASASPTYMTKLIHKYRNDEKAKVPEMQALVEQITAQCIVAIEEDRADCLILGCTPLQYFEDEIRLKLDEKGYAEIRLVCQYPAAIELAKLMVSMKLVQSPRAYPSPSLKAKPKYR
jgi:Asp/Glu/hydantoin racemase